MATATNQMWSSGGNSVSVVFNDANGAISQIVWTVASGALTVTVHQLGKQDIVRSVTTSGSVNVPNGYNLVPGPRGDWVWQGDLSFEIQHVG